MKIFLAAEKEKKQNQLKDMYTDKKNRIAAEKRETMGLNLIQKQIQDKDLKVEDLNVLLYPCFASLRTRF